MVHYIALFEFTRKTTEKDIEEMIRLSRTCFRRVDEAHNFRSGRRIDPKNGYAFFISADFENGRKLAMFRDDPNYRRFETEVVEAHGLERHEFLYETEPGKDPKYS